MAVLQALLTLIGRSAGKVLNAIFGWAVRALFGQTSSREQTFLSAIVAAAVAWPVLLLGLAAPKVAVLLVAFVPIRHWIPSWVVRLVWLGLAILVPLAVGLAMATKAPPESPRESSLKRMVRGFPITVGLAAAFLIMFVSVPVMRFAALVRRLESADIPLVTDGQAYQGVAETIAAVLVHRGFPLRRGKPGWWVVAPSRRRTRGPRNWSASLGGSGEYSTRTRPHMPGPRNCWSGSVTSPEISAGSRRPSKTGRCCTGRFCRSTARSVGSVSCSTRKRPTTEHPRRSGEGEGR